MNLATLDRQMTALSGGRWTFPPVVPVEPDDGALELFELQLGAMGEVEFAIDDIGEEWFERLAALKSAIVRTRAAGVRGVAVKMRCLRGSEEKGPAAEGIRMTHIPVTREGEMGGEMVRVEFHGDALWAREKDGRVLVAVKPICEELGINWNKQLQRIHRNAVLSEGMTMMVMPSAGGPQDTVCLPLELVNGWLFGIDDLRVRPELRGKILRYKRECYQILFDHFYSEATGRAPTGPTLLEHAFDTPIDRLQQQWLRYVNARY